MRCALCDAGVEGEEWVDMLIMGKKTPSQAARHFGTTPDNVMEHVYEHTVLGLIPEESAMPREPRSLSVLEGTQKDFDGLVSMDFYTTEIMQILAYLKRYSRSLSIHQSSSTSDIKTALQVMRELRLTIESLAEFQGRLASKSHTTINIESINMKLLSITNVIRTRLCPTCRKEMLAAIAEVDNSNQTPTIVPATISNTYQQ
jgi:hypothetical protein